MTECATFGCTDNATAAGVCGPCLDRAHTIVVGPDTCTGCGTSLIGVRPRLRTKMPGYDFRAVCADCAGDLMPAHATWARVATKACQDADFARTTEGLDS